MAMIPDTFFIVMLRLLLLLRLVLVSSTASTRASRPNPDLNVPGHRPTCQHILIDMRGGLVRRIVRRSCHSFVHELAVRGGV
jgi:hypothetical protein